jgi:hypothetical protein
MGAAFHGVNADFGEPREGMLAPPLGGANAVNRTAARQGDVQLQHDRLVQNYHNTNAEEARNRAERLNHTQKAELCYRHLDILPPNRYRHPIMDRGNVQPLNREVNQQRYDYIKPGIV